MEFRGGLKLHLYITKGCYHQLMVLVRIGIGQINLQGTLVLANIIGYSIQSRNLLVYHLFNMMSD